MSHISINNIYNQTMICFPIFISDNNTGEGWGGTDYHDAPHRPPPPPPAVVGGTYGTLTGHGNVFVKAEEISLVVLILVLWVVAIMLFVHR